MPKYSIEPTGRAKKLAMLQQMQEGDQRQQQIDTLGNESQGRTQIAQQANMIDTLGKLYGMGQEEQTTPAKLAELNAHTKLYDTQATNEAALAPFQQAESKARTDYYGQKESPVSLLQKGVALGIYTPEEAATYHSPEEVGKVRLSAKQAKDAEHAKARAEEEARMGGNTANSAVIPDIYKTDPAFQALAQHPNPEPVFGPTTTAKVNRDMALRELERQKHPIRRSAKDFLNLYGFDL